MPLYVRTLVLTAPLPDVEAGIAGHLAHLRALKAAGRLRAAGALGRRQGFLEIFEAKDLWEAEETARSSPLVADGLGAWTVREWEELEL